MYICVDILHHVAVITVITVAAITSCILYSLQVRAHNRKLRRDAKKRAAAGKVKQIRNDPGIPNSAPFKEELLRDAQLRKQRVIN